MTESVQGSSGYEISAANLGWFRRKLQTWAKQNLRDFPWRRTKSPFAIFVAEFLLQQTDAPRVMPVYEELMDKYPTLEALAAANPLELSVVLRPLGFHFRALRLQQIAQQLVEVPNLGSIPSDEKALLNLPGVGPYMARSICANAFDQSTAVVDTNVWRIYQRFFGVVSARARPRNDPSLWQLAQEAAPKRNVGIWNLTLIDFGAAICAARKPKCPVCPLQSRCVYASQLRV